MIFFTRRELNLDVEIALFFALDPVGVAASDLACADFFFLFFYVAAAAPVLMLQLLVSRKRVRHK